MLLILISLTASLPNDFCNCRVGGLGGLGEAPGGPWESQFLSPHCERHFPGPSPGGLGTELSGLRWMTAGRPRASQCQAPVLCLPTQICSPRVSGMKTGQVLGAGSHPYKLRTDTPFCQRAGPVKPPGASVPACKSPLLWHFISPATMKSNTEPDDGVLLSQVHPGCRGR